MLIKADILTREADRQKYGVISPRVFDYDSLEQCIKLSQRFYRSKMILRVMAEDHLFADLPFWANALQEKYSQAQIALMADGITSFEQAVQASMLGYTAIGIADSLPVEDEANLKLIRKISRIARARNLSVQVSFADLPAALGGRAGELVRAAKADMVKAMLAAPVTEDNIEQTCKMLHAARKETLATLALGDDTTVDIAFYERLKQSGQSKFDIFAKPAEAACERVKQIYEAEPVKSKKSFMIDLTFGISQAYTEQVRLHTQKAGDFAVRH